MKKKLYIILGSPEIHVQNLLFARSLFLFLLQFWNEVATSLLFEFWSFSISASERPADLNGKEI